MNSIEIVSVVLNRDSKCTLNCPGCGLGVKNREKILKLDISEIKERIDFIIEKIPPTYNLALLSGNVLLEYSLAEQEDILEYACSKGIVVQWELERIDERILNIFDSQIIVGLLRTNKLHLNIPYINGNLDLLEEIYSKIIDIGESKVKDILGEKELDYDKLIETEEGVELLKELLENELLFFILNIKDEHTSEMISFLEKRGFPAEERQMVDYDFGDLSFNIFRAGVEISFHKVRKQKLVNGINIWDRNHEVEGIKCSLPFSHLELSVTGGVEGKVVPHCNPCMEHISFGDMSSSSEDIHSSIEETKNVIRILALETGKIARGKKGQYILCALCKKYFSERVIGVLS